VKLLVFRRTTRIESQSPIRTAATAFLSQNDNAPPVWKGAQFSSNSAPFLLSGGSLE